MHEGHHGVSLRRKSGLSLRIPQIYLTAEQGYLPPVSLSPCRTWWAIVDSNHCPFVHEISSSAYALKPSTLKTADHPIVSLSPTGDRYSSGGRTLYVHLDPEAVLRQ